MSWKRLSIRFGLKIQFQSTNETSGVRALALALWRCCVDAVAGSGGVGGGDALLLLFLGSVVLGFSVLGMWSIDTPHNPTKKKHRQD